MTIDALSGYISWGPIQSEFAQNGTSFVSYDSASAQVKQGKWAVEAHDISLGDQSTWTKPKKQAVQAVFDTSYAGILLPPDSFNQFAQQMAKQTEPIYNDGTYFCGMTECYVYNTAELPTLNITIASNDYYNNYIIEPSGYMVEGGANCPCVFYVGNSTVGSDAGSLILGVSWFNNFIVSFDYNQNTITMAKPYWAIYSNVISTEIPAQPLHLAVIISSSIIGLLILIAIACCVCKKCLKKSESKPDTQVQQEDGKNVPNANSNEEQRLLEARIADGAITPNDDDKNIKADALLQDNSYTTENSYRDNNTPYEQN